MSEQRLIRVLVAEDETMMLRLLQRRIGNEPDLEVVGEAENGRQAVELALALKPDVVVMDLNMPGMNGVQATERILAQQPYTRVIILTALEELASLGKASGAFECIHKRATPEELVAAVRRAYASRHAPGEVEAPSGDHTAAVERLAMRHGLTDRERMVVERVVGTELTIHQIATALSKDLGEEVTHASVKHALDRALTKLRIEPRTRAALVKRVLELERADGH